MSNSSSWVSNSSSVVKDMYSEQPRRLRIALLGTRGLPPSYGGFETFAYELSRRLVQRGHSVCVYGRHNFRERLALVCDQEPWDGIARRSSGTLMSKYFETPLSALSAFLALRRQEFDLALLCNAANSPFAFLIKARRIPCVINVDGIERNRTKWNSLGKAWYKLGELSSVRFADQIVADARVIADYYQERYNRGSAVIAYGASREPLPVGETLAKFNLSPRQYILYVSRLEPENNALGVVQAYVRSGVGIPLLVVGDAPYSDRYKEELRKASNERVIFAGFQFGAAYRELRSHCLLYVQATEVGGTHPALVEGMAYGNCIIANDVPEHREVLQDCGVYYPKNDFIALSAILKELSSDPGQIAHLSTLAAARAQSQYSWEAITDSYEQLFYQVIAGS